MNNEAMIATMTEWQNRIKESNQIIDSCLEPLMLSPESPLYQAIWSLQSGYTKAVAEIVGDHWEWLDWYHGENDMGADGRECCPGTGHPMRKINTIADLAKLIQESK
ncbi:MAG: hypothetical protein KAX57_06945 [Rhodoferax sp.]|jgi:hypothetical protein|uniref:hypothetical protein n=1 Tax=Rhodoferax sp. TaxID=50421 RepID=UPI001B65E8D1|nr:hypothetical protein [Rhodoferax sp.]MBP8286561.1 hypothetical protein [Rhodoferax sp.]MBP9149205.1 hypothetical protein [Rhodoferax sp.]MBP9736156.1 hypothetical protein [Rhodoferax sp.]